MIIAKGESYPTAMLMVFKRTGTSISPKRSSMALPMPATNFTSGLLDVTNGFPSSMIQGGYDLHGERLHTWNTSSSQPAPGPSSYPVQLTITSLANEGRWHASDIRAIIAEIRRRQSNCPHGWRLLSGQLTRIKFLTQ